MAERGRRYFTTLNSFRGIAALCVALFHFKLGNPVTDSSFINNAWLFVDFFFVLSGFVLSDAYFYEKRFDFLTFIRARIARLYPLHIFTLLVYLGFETVKYVVYDKGWVHFNNPPFEQNSVSTFIQNVLMLHSFGLHDALSWNTPSWTISAEFYINLLIAAVIAVAGARRGKFFITALVAFLSSFAFLSLVTQSLDLTYDLGWLRCLYGFALGMLAYGIYRRIGLRLKPVFATVVEIAVAGISVFLVAHNDPGFQVFMPLVFALVVFVFAREEGRFSKIFFAKPLAFCGTISYSLYLNHAVLAIIMQKIHEKLFPADSMFYSLLSTALYLGVLCCYSALTYYIVEDPCRKWINKGSRGK